MPRAKRNGGDYRRPPEVDGWAGLRAQAVCAAVYESALAGQAVRVEDVLEEKVEAYQKEINEHWGL